MKTTVMIPAFNEERNIGRTLESLPAQFVNPVVVVNGSNDRTAEIARSFGATTLETERQGKLPAIQFALQALGSKALEPVILLDADTRPLMPRAWARTMTHALHPDDDIPAAVSAPVWFVRNDQAERSSVVSATARSMYRQAHGLLATINRNAPPAYYGPNQSFKLSNSDTLDAVLELGHFWPKEDVAMANAIKSTGGTFRQLIDTRAMTVSPESAAFAPLIDYIKKPNDVDRAVTEAYRKTAPTDSTTYEA